ncbi:hypothetical protein HK102_000904 [Quaeritorhiza haematococci]|nr:hypothetical protein HK102_000904 [Quaeritorhiza haematococci]
MKFAAAAAILASLFAGAVASPIAKESESAATAPNDAATNNLDPNEVYIAKLAYGGTGCPQGSVGYNFSPRRDAFTMIFDQYIASTGPGVPLTESRKNCQINLQVHVPNGYQYSIVTIDYRGFLQLDRNVVADAQSAYYFQGQLKEATARMSFPGPYSKDYVYRDQFAIDSTTWSPCGGNANLNMKTSIRVNNSANRAGQGLMTTDSIDGKVKQVFGAVAFAAPAALFVDTSSAALLDVLNVLNVLELPDRPLQLTQHSNLIASNGDCSTDKSHRTNNNRTKNNMGRKWEPAAQVWARWLAVTSAMVLLNGSALAFSYSWPTSDAIEASLPSFFKPLNLPAIISLIASLFILASESPSGPLYGLSTSISLTTRAAAYFVVACLAALQFTTVWGALALGITSLVMVGAAFTKEPLQPSRLPK